VPAPLASKTASSSVPLTCILALESDSDKHLCNLNASEKARLMLPWAVSANDL